MAEHDPDPTPHEALADTLYAPADSSPRAVDPSPVELNAARHERGDLLGAGGMGEVYLQKDRWIGREVAVKVLRAAASTPELRARFLTEARVQGQLEHPSIVPVYDLGTAEDGTPYFSMRRVRGQTLERVLNAVRDGESVTDRRYSRRRLLTALSSVCQAVAFAHQRGVVHRDLKPANVMLGEYGEVYVLDWGVAKILGVAELGPSAVNDGAPTRATQTAAGSLVGTPGYMAPEQAEGNNVAICTATDVYALGAILFEILTREPLHSAREVQQLLLETLRGEVDLPSERCPEGQIPPELDQICRCATHRNAEERYAHAGQMADAIERFLDGERDAELRAAQAARYLKGARERLESTNSRERTEAMRDVGRALALEPNNSDALGLLVDWVRRGTEEYPEEVNAALQQVEVEDRAKGAGRQAFSYAIWFSLTPLLVWMGVRSWPLLLGLGGLLLLVLAHALWVYRTGRAGRTVTQQNMVLSFVAISFTGIIFGPLFLLPGIAAGVAGAYAAAIRANPRTRVQLGVLASASVLLPFALQWLGVVPASYAFDGGMLTIRPLVVDFPEVPTLAFLLCSSITQIALVTALVGRGVDRMLIAERQNFTNAWHLRQLLPMQAADTLRPRRRAQ